MEFKIIEVLLGLNAVGWGLAWIMFKKQFVDVSAKVDSLDRKIVCLGERIAHLEGRVEGMMEKSGKQK